LPGVVTIYQKDPLFSRKGGSKKRSTVTTGAN
jgi:hypothetical protein